MKVETSGSKILFSFEGLENVLFNSNTVNAALHARAEMHGWEARIRDTAAISRKQKDGTVINVTEEMRRNEILATVAHYESGTAEWNMKSSRVAPQNPTILAIATAKGITYTEAEAWLQDDVLAGIAKAE